MTKSAGNFEVKNKDAGQNNKNSLQERKKLQMWKGRRMQCKFVLGAEILISIGEL